MQAVLLAAGDSSRFYPFGAAGHKSLVSLCARTFLSRALENLKKVGVKNIIIVEGMDEAVSKSLTPEDRQGISLKFVIQEKATGMGDALLSTVKYLDKSFFLLSAYHFEADLFISEITNAQKNPTDIVLLTAKTDNPTVFGTVSQVKGKIAVSEKIDKKNADKVVGIYLLTREFIDVLYAEKKDHYNFERALTAYSDKFFVNLVRAKKETLSLKYPWDLLEVKDYLLENISEHTSATAKVSKKAVITGPVFIGDGATIMEGAVIKGPAYIGKRAYVGTHAIIRDGVLVEEKAVVGAHMEIKNSILLSGATTHSGFIGDSVIGQNSKIAAGFHTGNVRLDRKEIFTLVKNEKVNTRQTHLGVFVGSNTSIGIKVGTMPGVIIGNNSVIGPGTTVMENIEDNTTYYTEFKKIVKKKT